MVYKSVFQSSKAALVFAGLTIFGAVSMVGTPEDEGVLDRTASHFAAQSEAAAQASSNSEASDAASENEDPDAAGAVFSDYNPGAPAPATTATDGTWEVIPGPQPVVADNEGIPVP
jgi:hypothetical protein